MEQGRAWFFDLMRRYGFEADRAPRRLAVAAVLVAWGVTCAGLIQQPTYKASALILVGWPQDQWWANSSGSGEEMQTLEYRGEPPTEAVMQAVASRTVAAETIERLDLPMEPDELLDNLTVEQAKNTMFIDLSYTAPDAQRAKLIANTLGAVASEFVSDRGEASVEIWRKAALPYMPVRPHPWRNGLLTLIVGLALSSAPIAPARAAAARAVGELGEYLHAVVQEAAQARLAGGRRAALREAERHKEQELLEALKGGRLSAVEAAMQTTLSVDEANRMLFDLAARGHLEITVEDGTLLYSFWRRDAPL